MKSGDENVLAKCKFFRKMQVTSCKICGRSDGRCRWKKRWFYAVPNVVVGMYSTRESLVRQKTAANAAKFVIMNCLFIFSSCFVLIHGSYIPPDPKPGGYNLCL